MERKGRNLNLFFGLIISFLVVLTYIFFHIENLRIGYEIEDLRKERNKLIEEIEILQIENAKLKNLKRIEKIARSLGMREVEQKQIMVLKISEKEGSNFLPGSRRGIAKKDLNFLAKREDK